MSRGACEYRRIGKLSEKLARSRRCKGRAVSYHVTGKFREDKIPHRRPSQKTCLVQEIYTGYERWPSVRTGWLIVDFNFVSSLLSPLVLLIACRFRRTGLFFIRNSYKNFGIGLLHQKGEEK